MVRRVLLSESWNGMGVSSPSSIRMNVLPSVRQCHGSSFEENCWLCLFHWPSCPVPFGIILTAKETDDCSYSMSSADAHTPYKEDVLSSVGSLSSLSLHEVTAVHATTAKSMQIRNLSFFILSWIFVCCRLPLGGVGRLDMKNVRNCNCPPVLAPGGSGKPIVVERANKQKPHAEYALNYTTRHQRLCVVTMPD